MFFSSQPDSELPSLGDLVETPDGEAKVRLIIRDKHGTYWVNGYPVEIIRRGVEPGKLAMVNIPAYYTRIKSKMELLVLSQAEYAFWARLLSEIDAVSGWLWKPVTVVKLETVCKVLGADEKIHQIPRDCLKGISS